MAINTIDIMGLSVEELDAMRESVYVGSPDWYAILDAYNYQEGSYVDTPAWFGYGEDVWQTYIERNLPDTIDWMGYFGDLFETNADVALFSLYQNLASPLNQLDVELHPDKYTIDSGWNPFDIPIVGDVLETAFDISGGIVQAGYEAVVEPVADLVVDPLVEVAQEIGEPIGELVGEEVLDAWEGIVNLPSEIEDLFDVPSADGQPMTPVDIPQSTFTSGDNRYGRRQTIYSELPTDWVNPRESLVAAPSLEQSSGDIDFYAQYLGIVPGEYRA